MKLGVITDGISRDLPYALNVMDEFGLTHAELQFVGTSEVGDHTADAVGIKQTVVLLGGRAGERVKPMREVRGAALDRP